MGKKLSKKQVISKRRQQKRKTAKNKAYREQILWRSFYQPAPKPEREPPSIFRPDPDVEQCLAYFKEYDECKRNIVFRKFEI